MARVLKFSRINRKKTDHERETGEAAARKASRDVATGGAADGRTFDERQKAKRTIR